MDGVTLGTIGSNQTEELDMEQAVGHYALAQVLQDTAPPNPQLLEAYQKLLKGMGIE